MRPILCKNRIMRWIPVLLATLLPLATLASDSANFRVPLAATPLDSDASAVVSGSFKSKKSSFAVAAVKLAPSQSYRLVIDGRVVGEAVSSKAGAWGLKFEAPDKKKTLRLDFDPRGAVVEVRNAGEGVVLEGVFSGAGEKQKSNVSESVELEPAEAGSTLKASARYALSSSGIAQFKVSLAKLGSTLPVDLRLDGQPIAQNLAVERNGSLKVTFRSPAKDNTLPLDFDPRGGLLDVIQDGAVIATAEVRAKAYGANLAERVSYRLPIPSAQTPAEGRAVAKWTVDERARRKFSVEIEDVEEGDYELSVGGVVRGVFSAVDGEDGVEGEIEFENDDDDDSQPLDFDPVGAQVEIRMEGTLWFAGAFDPESASGAPGAEPESQLEEDLAGTGAMPGASGRARYEVDDKGRHRFSVEIGGVPEGSYVLRVAGVQRALLKAAVEEGDDAVAEVEFRNPPERGKIALDFDPRGQLLEIADATGLLLFSHILGEGSAQQPGAEPVYMALALLAAPDVEGGVLAVFKREADGDAKFKLKTRGLAVGDYAVDVGGVERGTLSVVADGDDTEGELEFETDPDDGELLLDFAVEGEEVAVRSGDTVLFSRVLQAP